MSGIEKMACVQNIPVHIARTFGLLNTSVVVSVAKNIKQREGKNNPNVFTVHLMTLFPWHRCPCCRREYTCPVLHINCDVVYKSRNNCGSLHILKKTSEITSLALHAIFHLLRWVWASSSNQCSMVTSLRRVHVATTCGCTYRRHASAHSTCIC